MDCLNKLPEQYLMKADKATMAFAVEERLPLLDRNVIEFAFSLPASQKRDKLCLRKAVEDLLPEDIVWRKKQGFGTPIREWMQNATLKKVIKDRLLWGKFLDEITNPSAMASIRANFRLGYYDREPRMALSPANVVWSLFALQTWWDTWFK
jgi:asparagine synthase (glutamine-hydrolysing)